MDRDLHVRVLIFHHFEVVFLINFKFRKIINEVSYLQTPQLFDYRQLSSYAFDQQLSRHPLVLQSQ